MIGKTNAMVQGGITPTGTITITSNGTHNVKNYETAYVNVPTTIIPNEIDAILFGNYNYLTEEVCAQIMNGTYVYQS